MSFSKRSYSFNLLGTTADNQGMMVTLYKKDRQGQPYYYTVHDRQGSLFAPFTLTIMWGKKLDRPREKVLTFTSEEEMNRKIRVILDKKLREGYRVLYSYFRPDEAIDLKERIAQSHM
jgi:predicted DNA-binding WGR domain protein